MADYQVVLPSKPKVVEEKGNAGIYEIEGLYPGFGHTLANALRRIILASLPGAAITSVKITGVNHEFSTMPGVKEDVISILLNLKKLRFALHSDEPKTARLSFKGIGNVKSGDIELPTQIEIADKNIHIATITDKNTELEIEMTVEKGLGYIPKEVLHKDKMGVGVIALDATFAPVKKVSYEVENMRVGDRTDFNRLKMFIETDGVITPREALESSIATLINQLRAIVGFKEEDLRDERPHVESDVVETTAEDNKVQDPTKMKIEDLEISSRTMNALTKASIRTVGGLARKSVEDLLEVEGLGDKAINEIKDALEALGLELKQ